MRFNCAVATLLMVVSVAGANAQQASLAEFTARVAAYDSLRRALETGTAVLKRSHDPAEIHVAARELARRIRAARAGAVRGDIITPADAQEFIRRVRAQLDGPTWSAVMDDNPGELSCEVNSEYPAGMPVSTVPPNILAALPPLPDGLEYRFLGRHLILRDARANLIVEYVPYVLASCDCDNDPEEIDY